jgi:hypothetical protein
MTKYYIVGKRLCGCGCGKPFQSVGFRRKSDATRALARMNDINRMRDPNYDETDFSVISK